MDPKDPQNQQPFNPNIPISEVLRQEKEGFTPSAPLAAATQEPNTPSAPSTVDKDFYQRRIIKTYSTDMAEAMRLQQQGNPPKTIVPQKQVIKETKETPTMTPAMVVEKSPEPIYVNSSIKPKHHKILVPIIVVVILLVLGAGSIIGVQYFLNQKKVEVPITTTKTIIPFDHQESITLDPATYSNLTTAVTNLKTGAYNVDYIQVFEKILNGSNQSTSQQVSQGVFAGAIGPNMPGILLRSFDGDYMYGIDGLKHPREFIIFKTSSYDQTFAGMLKWESKMVQDLTPILNLSPKTASYTFSDQVINNKDVRAVVDPDGTIYVLYGFLDNQTLLITTDAATFQDINSRYVATRFVQ